MQFPLFDRCAEVEPYIPNLSEWAFYNPIWHAETGNDTWHGRLRRQVRFALLLLRLMQIICLSGLAKQNA